MADRRHTLRRFPVVATTSVEEAHDAVTDVYLPHALRADTSLRMELNAARQKRFTLGFLAYGAKAELRMPPPRRPTTSTSPPAAARSPSAATGRGR